MKFWMGRYAALAITGLLTVTLVGCGAGTDTAGQADGAAQACELNVFAAASMQETLEQIADQYEAENPGVAVLLNLDSSGTLKTQIEQGADCDVFISAAQKQMDELDIAVDADKNPDRLDFVDDATRVDLLENQVVLVVPEGNPKNIQSFSDIASRSELIALGNSDVTVGQYSEEILRNLGLWDALNAAGKITYGSNVKEVTTQVAEGVADCGIVYATDAFSAGLTAVDEATEDLCGQVIYPAAVMKHSAQKEQATAFLEYLQTDAASEIFESVGFHPLTE